MSQSCCVCVLFVNSIIIKIKPVVTGSFGPPKAVLHQWSVNSRGIGGFTVLGWPEVSLVSHDDFAAAILNEEEQSFVVFVVSGEAEWIDNNTETP